jgi:hypothetical protein
LSRKFFASKDKKGVGTCAICPGVRVVDGSGIEFVFGAFDDFVEDCLLDLFDLFFEMVLDEVVDLAEAFANL